ncbi:MAG: 50S ribosomal protein L11 methyltransferase [Ignavibacteriota bacterium]|nr:50S ribosomal protein L11 methyltransferase [Ignavibacteriales bacterium]MBL1123984.1 50S ribosomal protein L11 methyltransferase [Ignavibacteriota bacterium]MCC7093433.1 50S ribosomal protein L11 methyltransferase [Ignavibacteriaceae bacterium]MEB2296625.1 50S ribosomal protein L11 methyltransferase [Ignavibacteria bacterium]MCZ7612301.1 50S ribosomal protein L11 methyltransferase [Ignavibacteriaceae bacterium]
MKKFLIYKIYTQPFDTELLSGIMWEFNITGLLENDDHVSVFISDIDLAVEAKLNSSLMKLKNENFIESFRVEKEILEDKNWNEEWEKSREVIRISDRIVIKPTFKNYSAKENEIVLTIDPKMSFGTGEHQTTKLILQLLEDTVKPGIKVLDVGSGTGILAIASIKLGASKAVAVDSDEICLDNCNENCSLNQVVDSVKILTGEIDAVNENDFDLILANIQKNVLIEIAEKLKSRLNKNGFVILSGLLDSDFDVIRNKYYSIGFEIRRIEKEDEWIALVLGF